MYPFLDFLPLLFRYFEALLCLNIYGSFLSFIQEFFTTFKNHSFVHMGLPCLSLDNLIDK